MNFEVKMTDWFFSKKCFLEIGNFKLNQLKNIFFINDLLYIPLKSSKLLPFTKLKRILQDHREVSFDSINSITITPKINKNIVNKDVNPNVKNMKNMIYKNVNNSCFYDSPVPIPFELTNITVLEKAPIWNEELQKWEK